MTDQQWVKGILEKTKARGCLTVAPPKGPLQGMSQARLMLPSRLELSCGRRTLATGNEGAGHLGHLEPNFKYNFNAL